MKKFKGFAGFGSIFQNEENLQDPLDLVVPKDLDFSTKSTRFLREKQHEFKLKNFQAEFSVQPQGVEENAEKYFVSNNSSEGKAVHFSQVDDTFVEFENGKNGKFSLYFDMLLYNTPPIIAKVEEQLNQASADSQDDNNNNFYFFQVMNL